MSACLDLGGSTVEGHGLLEDLTAAQRRAVVIDAAPLAIIAGAGSGKTRVLTRRIAHRLATGTAQPQHVLALTFTRRAAAELCGRLAALGVRERVAAGTFHAMAYSQLRRLWADRGDRPPALLDHKARLIVALFPRHAPRRPALTARHARTTRPERPVGPGEVAAEIEWAKARMVPPSRYEDAAARLGRRPPLPAPAMASLYQDYEHEKRRRGLVDFDDLVLLCALALETDRQFAANQRWRFRHLFVDEFQDLNPVQFRLLEGWRGDRSDLCVVGDPNQAIYGWNGADPEYLTRFERRFADATVLHLDENFRSSRQVIAVANAVLPTASGRCLQATRGDGPVPTVTSFATDRDEAEGVARALRRRHASGRPWSHLAVLTRTHAQLVLLEEALRTAAIPYRLRGAAAFLDRPEIREALSELRRRPPGTPLSSAVPDLLELAAGGGADRGDASEQADPESDERRQHLESLARLAADQLALDRGMSVASFVGWLVATLRNDDADVPTDALELATLHAAKGLEWPVVFVAGLEQGLVPIGHAESPEAREEERRLFYVAVTRAEQELHCSWAERRTFGNRTLSRIPSPYLMAVEAARRALTAEVNDSDWRRHLRQARAEAGHLEGRPDSPAAGRPTDPRVDPGLLAALKSWRATAARAAGVPAFVIFHDSTLAAMAAARPADRAALLAVPGVGPLKSERYGDAVLEVVAGPAPGSAIDGGPE